MTTLTTSADKSKLSPIDNHKEAAKHHEAAAKHHNEAVKHHDAGNTEKALKSTVIASGHHTIAGEHQTELNKHHAMHTK
jgi:hypothetical protein